MLDGVKRNSDESDRWHDVADRIEYNIQAVILSPDSQYLATCAELKAMLGMRVYQVGALYDLTSNSIIGRICTGRRSRENWTETVR